MCPYLKEFLRLSFLYQVVRVLINRSSAISLLDTFDGAKPRFLNRSVSDNLQRFQQSTLALFQGLRVVQVLKKARDPLEVSIPNHPLMSRKMGCVPILLSFLPLTIACSLK